MEWAAGEKKERKITLAQSLWFGLLCQRELLAFRLIHPHVTLPITMVLPFWNSLLSQESWCVEAWRGRSPGDPTRAERKEGATLLEASGNPGSSQEIHACVD